MLIILPKNKKNANKISIEVEGLLKDDKNKRKLLSSFT